MGARTLMTGSRGTSSRIDWQEDNNDGYLEKSYKNSYISYSYCINYKGIFLPPELVYVLA
jgi:hypothetical protein